MQKWKKQAVEVSTKLNTDLDMGTEICEHVIWSSSHNTTATPKAIRETHLTVDGLYLEMGLQGNML